MTAVPTLWNIGTNYVDYRYQLGLSATNQATALITLLEIKGNEDFAKRIITTWCYSGKALEAMRQALVEKPVRDWWAEYRQARSAATTL